MRQKSLIYIIVLITLITTNIYYHRHFFIQKWMHYAVKDQHVVISLTTTPYRINNIQPTIDSLLAQNINIKNIYLSIPHKFKRDNLEYVIPKWLLENSKVTILRTEDYGPATKLLGVLEKKILPSNAIIIVVDDDAIYPDNLALNLAYKAKFNPDRAIGIMGANPDYDEHGEIKKDSALGLIKIKKADALVSILQGYAGVAYRSYFFDESIFEVVNTNTDCFNSDDIFLSFYLAKHNIARQVLRNKYITSCNIMWETNMAVGNTALHKLTRTPTQKHHGCIAYLQQKYPGVKF